MNILALDIGGTKLAAAMIDGSGKISERRQIATPASQTPEALQTSLGELLAPLQAHASLLAVASTGIIYQGVLTALNPDNLGGLNQFPLQYFLQQLTGLECIVINDAQAAAWAEYKMLLSQPASTTVSDMAFVTVSTGVGGGLVLNNKLHTGTGGLAGHLGHTLADPNGPRCGCGRTGCVEAIASGRGIAAAARDELQGLDAKAIFQHAVSGNAQAQQLINRSAQTVALLIADIKASTDCQQVIIGGSVGLAAGYLATVHHFLAQQPAAYQVPLHCAYHQCDAGLIGAALWALEQSS